MFNKKKISVLISVLISCFGFSQDSLEVISSVKIIDSFVTSAKVINDSIALDKSNNPKLEQYKITSDSVKAKLQNTKIYTDFTNALADDATLAQIDQNYLASLERLSEYDSLYKHIQHHKYDEIEYVKELPTDTLKARLEKLNAKTPFNVAYNPSLESVIKGYLKHRFNLMKRLQRESAFYFPMFEEVLDKYDLPLEIKYLAVVESALKPRAKSRVGATGLWQFMFGTGKMYKLGVNSYVDDRMDPIKSTEAAAKYLASLYKIFGDWDLALAAYNSGPGNVTKAIRRSGGYSNYWNLRPFLPRETAGYLPAFLANMYLFEYAKEHHFTFEVPENHYFKSDTIRVKKSITLEQISEVIDEPIENLQFLNPQYKLDVIPFVEGKDYRLRLPVEKLGTFVMHEDAIYANAEEELKQREKPLPQLFEMDARVRYRIQSGDYLGKIARKFGVRVSDLRKWNGMRNNNIRVGKYLSVYPRRIPKNTNNISGTTSTAKKPIQGGYTVQDGDSLWSISQKFTGVSIEDLRRLNNLKGNNLKVGMKLRLK